MSQETKILSGIGILTVILVIAGAFLLGGNSGNSQTLTSDQQRLLVRPDSQKISSSSAKVTVVEFGDYQCPACGAAEPVVERILKEFKGKINFVFRNFAFLGEESTWAAEAAECAAEQGKFWEYHNFLYSHQDGENKGAFSKENLKKFTKSFNMNQEQFNLCLDTDKYSQKVANDRSDGNDLGVNSTPTFFINGEKSRGVLGFDNFKAKIEEKLK